MINYFFDQPIIDGSYKVGGKPGPDGIYQEVFIYGGTK